MSGSLTHSPAQIIRQLLVDLGLGQEPVEEGPNNSWPVYSTLVPPKPDNIICVYDTEGVMQGREMVEGEQAIRHGVQVLLRSSTHTLGYPKSNNLAIALDEVYNQVVTIGTSQYRIQSISRTTDVIPIGRESDVSQRRMFSINALVSVRQEFNLYELNDIILWLDSQEANTLYQDTASTIPVTTLGDSVLKFLGKLTGRNASGTLGDHPVYDPDGIASGKPGVKTDGGSLLSDAIPVGSDWTIYIVCKPTDFSSLNILLGSTDGNFYFGDTGNNGSSLGTIISGHNPTAGNGGNSLGALNGRCGLSPLRGMIISIVATDSKCRVCLDGAEAGFPISSSIFNLGPTFQIRIGRYGPGGFGYKGIFGELVVCNTAHDSDTTHNVLRYLSNKWGVGYGVEDQRLLTCVGSSLTNGTGSETSYPTTLASLLDTSWSLVNAGIGSVTTQQLYDRRIPMIEVYDAHRRANIAVIWEVYNHFDQGYPGITARAAVDLYWLLCDAWRAAGWKVIAVTLLHRLGITNATEKNVLADSSNTFIRDEWEDHADALADIQSITELQDPSNVLYFTDQIHLTSLGGVKVAQAVESAALSIT